MLYSHRDSSTDTLSPIYRPRGLILPIHSTHRKDMATSSRLIGPVDVIQPASMSELKHLLTHPVPRQVQFSPSSCTATHPLNALLRVDGLGADGVAQAPRPFLPMQATDALKFMRPLQFQIDDFIYQQDHAAVKPQGIQEK